MKIYFGVGDCIRSTDYSKGEQLACISLAISTCKQKDERPFQTVTHGRLNVIKQLDLYSSAIMSYFSAFQQMFGRKLIRLLRHDRDHCSHAPL